MVTERKWNLGIFHNENAKNVFWSGLSQARETSFSVVSPLPPSEECLRKFKCKHTKQFLKISFETPLLFICQEWSRRQNSRTLLYQQKNAVNSFKVNRHTAKADTHQPCPFANTSKHDLADYSKTLYKKLNGVKRVISVTNKLKMHQIHAAWESAFDLFLHEWWLLNLITVTGNVLSSHSLSQRMYGAARLSGYFRVCYRERLTLERGDR